MKEVKIERTSAQVIKDLRADLKTTDAELLSAVAREKTTQDLLAKVNAENQRLTLVQAEFEVYKQNTDWLTRLAHKQADALSTLINKINIKTP